MWEVHMWHFLLPATLAKNRLIYWRGKSSQHFLSNKLEYTKNYSWIRWFLFGLISLCLRFILQNKLIVRMVNEFPQVRNNYTGTSDSAQALLYHQPSVRLKLNDSRQSVNETNRQFTLHFRKVVLTLSFKSSQRLLIRNATILLRFYYLVCNCLFF